MSAVREHFVGLLVRFKEQNKIFLICRLFLLAFALIFSVISCITPFVMFLEPHTASDYIFLYPCQVLPFISLFGFIVSIWSFAMSGLTHFIISLLLFGHWTFLLSFEVRGAAWRMALIVEFFMLIISVLTCIVDFVQECKSPKFQGTEYDVQVDDENEQSVL
eukprot:gene3741-6629_t